jgi:NADH-quinone oxidoreductase subunit J
VGLSELIVYFNDLFVRHVFDLVFLAVSFVTVLSALGVVFFRNIVHSALSLVVTFLGVAALFITLEAEYLALVQVLVYGGAVSVLIVFALMLIQRGSVKETNMFGRLAVPAFFTAFAVFALIGWSLLQKNWVVKAGQTPAAAGNAVFSIAEVMLARYVFPFEIAAVLLLVAMIAAIVIGKEVKGTK